MGPTCHSLSLSPLRVLAHGPVPRCCPDPPVSSPYLAPRTLAVRVAPCPPCSSCCQEPHPSPFPFHKRVPPFTFPCSVAGTPLEKPPSPLFYFPSHSTTCPPRASITSNIVLPRYYLSWPSNRSPPPAPQRSHCPVLNYCRLPCAILQIDPRLTLNFPPRSCTSTTEHRRPLDAPRHWWTPPPGHSFYPLAINLPFRWVPAPSSLLSAIPMAHPCSSSWRGYTAYPFHCRQLCHCTCSTRGYHNGFTPPPCCVAQLARLGPPCIWPTDQGGPPGTCGLLGEAGCQPASTATLGRIRPTGKIFLLNPFQTLFIH
jgi:hypothetical protein